MRSRPCLLTGAPLSPPVAAAAIPPGIVVPLPKGADVARLRSTEPARLQLRLQRRRVGVNRSTPTCLCRGSSATRTPQSRRDCGCGHAAAVTGGAAATAAAIAATLSLHWGWGEGRRWGGWRRAAADTDNHAASECKRALRPELPKGTSGSTTARVAAGADYRPSIRCAPVRPPSPRRHAQRARLRSGYGAQGQRRRRRRWCPPPAWQPRAVGQPSEACAGRESHHGQCLLWAAFHLRRRSLLHVACSSTTFFESSRMRGAHVLKNTTSTSNNR